MKANQFLEGNPNIEVIDQKGIFKVIQHKKDLSVNPGEAVSQFFQAKMGYCKRQVVVDLVDNAIRLKPGEMQMMLGDIQQTTGVKGVGDLFGKVVKSKMTGDNAIKPLYKGTGILITEPTYTYPILIDVGAWGGVVCDDGMFICCDDEVKDTVTARTNISSAVLGGEGLFNLALVGKGYAVVKSPCPQAELYEFELDNDVIRIDGNNAVCWSKSLDFTVERSGKTLIGSAASGEGLVNVYRGTGRILVSPLR